MDLTRKPSLWEWAMTDSAWYRELVQVWNAYHDEKRSVEEARRQHEELRNQWR